MPFVPLRRSLGRLYDFNLNNMLKELFGMSDIAQAERVVFSTYGDTVSVEQKAKNLNKFGRNDNVDTGQACTIANFQGSSQYEETFVWDNLIDSAVSSNASDAQTAVIEGHTVNTSTGDFTFSTQEVTLNGQTPVTLTTPLARINRFYVKASGTFNSPQTGPAGNIAFYDSSATSVTSGVPGTDAAVKMYIPTGQTQSRKCQTTISSQDYWFLSGLDVSIRSGSPSTKVEYRIERRSAADGGVWRPLGPEISLDNGDATVFYIEFRPFLIVPKNNDVRVTATSTSNNTSVTAELHGYLAKII